MWAYRVGETNDTWVIFHTMNPDYHISVVCETAGQAAAIVKFLNAAKLTPLQIPQTVWL